MLSQPIKYNLKCRTCKKKTEHSIYHLSRKRGAKLHCLNCGTKTLNYHNIQNLQEYSVTKSGGLKNETMR